MLLLPSSSSPQLLLSSTDCAHRLRRSNFSAQPAPLQVSEREWRSRTSPQPRPQPQPQTQLNRPLADSCSLSLASLRCLSQVTARMESNGAEKRKAEKSKEEGDDKRQRLMQSHPQPQPPRHFHAGPTPVDRELAELYRDALHCVFDFLAIFEVATLVLPLCKTWRAAALSMKAREVWLLLSLADATGLLHSPLRRHASSLEVMRKDVLTFGMLQRIRHSLPQLTEIQGRLDPTLGAVFGEQLQTLTLTLVFRHEEEQLVIWQQVSSVISAAATCPHLEGVALRSLPSGHPPLDLLQPLTRLAPSLRSLELRVEEEEEFLPLRQQNVDVLRLLPQLTEVNLGDWSAEELAWLTADPPPMQLHSRRSVGVIRCIMSEHAAYLSLLPNLTFLSTNSLDLEDASFIGGLRRLRTVELRREEGEAVDLQLLMTALAQCNEIEELTLAHEELTGEQLATLLPHLPRLHELCLVDCPELRSLSFLTSTPHLASTLLRLDLIRGGAILSLLSCSTCSSWMHSRI